jgi:signal transduction histidine kinase/ligand-binding sensor domain-containing protein/DNA-binding NarL/FixJ family response regulator
MNRICFLILFLPCLAWAQIEDYKLYNISREEGLPTENVQYIFQDSYGFLWIASFDGLFRWDGNTYKKYVHADDDSKSLSNNVVYVVFEDYKKRLWIGTLRGLDLYDREKDNFISCDFNEKASKIAVNAIVEDSKKQLWLGASNGLYHYDYDNNKSTWYATDPSQANSLTDHVVFGLAIDQFDNLWIGTFHGGLNKYSISEKKFSSYKHEENNPSTICSNIINTVMVDHANNVWIGSYDKGVTVMDNNGKVLKHYRITPSTSKIHNIVSALYEDKENRIWIGTIKEPLYYLDSNQNQLVPFNNTPYKKINVPCESITHITADNFGNLWFGTLNEGLFYTNTEKNVFKYYSNDNKASEGLKGKIISSFYESNDGNVWIGTSGGGLSLFDVKHNTFKTYTKKDGLSNNDIYDVKEDNAGNVWIGAWNGGLIKLDKRTQKFTTYINDPTNINSLNYNNVKAILPDDSVVWLGTQGEGLVAYDIKHNVFIHKLNNKVFPFDMGLPAWINHLMLDSKNRIWISTYNGVFVYDRKTLSHHRHTEAENTISNSSVNMVMEDKQGNILVLNEKGGVDLFNERDKDFTRYYQSIMSSKAFVIDDNGTMWISSNDGINAVDLKTKTSKMYDASDGLIANSFFQKAVMKSKSGHLFFGSTYGFNVFHPDSIRTINYKVTPYLTSLFIYDQAVVPGAKDSPLKRILNFTDTLCLSYKQSFFTIGFTTSNLLSGNKTQFSYKLEGLHENWIRLNEERKASFTNLDPGTYTFRLRYTNADGEWMDSPKHVVIIVTPPWWLTTWFKLFVFMCVTGLIVLIFYIRLHSIRQRNKHLEDEVSKRTHDLKEANYFLQERNIEINRQSEKILLQQEHILTQNKELEKSILEARKLHQIKDRFFYILAHDLRNPISTFAGITDTLRLGLMRLEKKEIARYVDTLQKSAKGIYNLLTNLLHWANTHANTIENSPTDFAIDKLIRNNAQLLEQQFEQKNITLNIHVNANHSVLADYNMLDAVIRNLLTNSIKFTYEGGEVNIESKEVEEEIVISISDNGMGMSKEQLDNLFNVERTSLSKGTAGETGTGLGLIIAREFIQANKGSISLVSTEGKGSTFRIRLPKSKNDIRIQNEINTVVAGDKLSDITDLLPVEEMVKIRGRKILLVEDNPELRDYLKLFLSETFEIFEAKNGKEGLNAAIEIQPTAIISDLTMPVMDGVEFCREIKQNPSTNHIPFILLTSNSSDESQLVGYNAGADVYLTKPVTKGLLFQVIMNFIGNQEKIRQKILNSNGFLTNDVVINKSDEEFLNKVIAIIEKNVSDPNLDYRVIAEEIAISKTVLYSKLKAITDLGIQEFIKSIRLKKSLKYLSEGKLAISEIASSVGFSSQSYFNKCFIKQFDMTPKAYMNKNKKGVVQ